MTYFEGFKMLNNIDFEVRNFHPELKRKEIQLYNPLHYVFGFVLESKPWLTYEERYL